MRIQVAAGRVWVDLDGDEYIAVCGAFHESGCQLLLGDRGGSEMVIACTEGQLVRLTKTLLDALLDSPAVESLAGVQNVKMPNATTLVALAIAARRAGDRDTMKEVRRQLDVGHGIRLVFRGSTAKPPRTPALERYRIARAELAELELAERKGKADAE